MTVGLEVFTPLPLTRRGPSYPCAMLAGGMADDNLEVTITTPFARHPVFPAKTNEALPWYPRHLPFRWTQSWAYREIENAFLKRIVRSGSRASAAHVWPDPSLAMMKELKRHGLVVFREMINTHRG